MESNAVPRRRRTIARTHTGCPDRGTDAHSRGSFGSPDLLPPGSPGRVRSSRPRVHATAAPSGGIVAGLPHPRFHALPYRVAVGELHVLTPDVPTEEPTRTL